LGEFIEYLLARADARPRCAYIVARKKSHQPTICDNHVWKYDTEKRDGSPMRDRSLAGQGFAGSATEKRQIFGMSHQDKSRGLFAMQATCEKGVRKTKGRGDCVARHEARKGETAEKR
jgi:hypothetical protein